ncbi:MAG: hypothetical protein ABI904_22485 [Chloroflexota bacterium]
MPRPPAGGVRDGADANEDAEGFQPFTLKQTPFVKEQLHYDYLMICAQPVPLQAGQGESFRKPLFRPRPLHKAHFFGGATTNTLPLPPQAGQAGSIRKPLDFPRPLHQAQS